MCGMSGNALGNMLKSAVPKHRNIASSLWSVGIHPAENKCDVHRDSPLGSHQVDGIAVVGGGTCEETIVIRLETEKRVLA